MPRSIAILFLALVGVFAIVVIVLLFTQFLASLIAQ